jgi:hypothetical protein
MDIEDSASHLVSCACGSHTKDTSEYKFCSTCWEKSRARTSKQDLKVKGIIDQSDVLGSRAAKPSIRFTMPRLFAILVSVTIISLLSVYFSLGRNTLDLLSYATTWPADSTISVATNHHLLPLAQYHRSKPSHSKTLGVLSQIVVVSLPRRRDRRAYMDRMRYALDLEWVYVDAFDANDTKVQRVMDAVRYFRSRDLVAFMWDPDRQHLDSDRWSLDPQPALVTDEDSETPLTCAIGDAMIPEYDPTLRPHQILSKAMVACWMSHLLAIRIAAANLSPTLILEDDVDIDEYIEDKLRLSWDDLPPTWDILYLGSLPSNSSMMY